MGGRMMYICEDCGKLIEELPCEIEELSLSEEFPSYTVKVPIPLQCSCGGDFVEAGFCVKCRNYTASSYEICNSCLEDAKTLDNCLEIGDEWQGTVKLNGFLFTFFDTADIEHILKEHLKKSPKEEIEKAIKEYYEDDEDYFMGWLQSKWKEEK
jgi:hypothetical protein